MEPTTAYRSPSFSRDSATRRRSSDGSTRHPPGRFSVDLCFAPLRVVVPQFIVNQTASQSPHAVQHGELFVRGLGAHDFRHLVIHDFVSLRIKPHWLLHDRIDFSLWNCT